MSIKKISVSAEEFALICSIAGRPEVGRSHLASVTGETSDDDRNSRLVAAGHSLLARGLVEFSNGKSPVVSDSLNQALLPIFKTDDIYQLFVSEKDVQSVKALYLNEEHELFTAQSIELGVVVQMEMGESQEISKFVVDQMAPSLAKGKQKHFGTDHQVNAKMISAISVENSFTEDHSEAFLKAGLEKSVANALGKDLKSVRSRGSLIKLDVEHGNPFEQENNEFSKALLTLVGSSSNWAFIFNEAGSEAVADIYQVTAKGMQEVVSSFVT
jgi:hypothetical protein